MISQNNTNRVLKVSIPVPSLQDNTADADRLAGVLKARLKTDVIDIDLSILKKLPDLLRKWNYNVCCVIFKDRGRWIINAIDSPDSRNVFGGIAVDLGTSRIVLRLLDLVTGETMAEASFDNPQIEVGPDVLVRIHFADSPGGLETLRRLIIDGLNREIEKLCNNCNIGVENLYGFSVAGNTAMTHLFMGLNPRWIIREPYIPVVNRPGIVKSKDLGIKANPLARVLIFPNIGSYFGGDLIAGILFSGINKMEKAAILVDVGTNAEVLLGNKNWLIACAGAAGPALEGGVTRMGMMAGPGVIDRVFIDPDTYDFKLHTIDNMPPKGICGSGLIDLAAHLFLSGMMDIRGKLIPEICGKRLVEKDGIKYLVVLDEQESDTDDAISISQADLDSLTRSKAAMFTILETITMSVGMKLDDISVFYVAGTFGSFIDPKSAISIGMLPDLPVDRYKSLGNSSLQGAAKALLSTGSIDEIDRIRDSITYLELNVNQEFMNRFSAARFFPHTDRSRFPSVGVWGKSMADNIKN